MTADELLTAMRAALESERDAIRRLDSNGVTRASIAKERVLASVLKASSGSERAALAAALEELKPELRRNLVLLAHARDSVAKAIELVGTKGRPRLEAKL